MKIKIPELSLVVLIGPSGAGKSTFARRHFQPFEVLSSDYCRGLVSNNENDQGATNDAFEVLHYLAGKRLKRGHLTVVDATSVQPEARQPLVALARAHHVLPVAIVFDLPDQVCRERNRGRADRDFGPEVIRRQSDQLRRSLRKLGREGFRHIFVLDAPEQVDAVEITRDPLWNNRRHEHGPFDIIGDVHGCLAELTALLRQLQYAIGTTEDAHGETVYEVTPPAGRKAIFLGDLVDRGPDSPGVVRLVMSMVEAGTALCVPGNHDMKLVRKLKGKDVQIAHGLAETLQQLEREPVAFHQRVADFLDDLVSHYVLDDGKLVVAHAGMKAELQGRGSGTVRAFALYGQTTGETDDFGLPVRYDWAAEYRGAAAVVYGHTPVPEPEWINNTICIDTGCVFGGQLTALRYPERELISVPAASVYAEPARPFLAIDQSAPRLSEQQRLDDVLDIEDVRGKRLIETRLHGKVTVREENATAALEVMSRFALDPRWLIYLPPTMSPAETSKAAGLLEHPAEAFSYFRHEGVGRVICQEKHMGSRAVLVLCKDADAVRRRFGVESGELGAVYTRTGRRFFADADLESEFINRIRSAASVAGLWTDLDTDWLCLDAELLPWSAKAQELLRGQYAAVGSAARVSLAAANSALQQTMQRQPEIEPLAAQYSQREALVAQYVDAYRRYCWNVESINDLRLAPFHLLASENSVHTAREHAWHLERLARLAQADSALLIGTANLMVDVTDPASTDAGIRWWEQLTERGGEGMVVKPLEFVARGRRGLIQPAIKCRGREYLRIIYGPEYTEPQNLERLRVRGLGHKRSLALRELALGIEGLERFVRREPLRRVHECVFGVLALESEPVDPRL